MTRPLSVALGLLAFVLVIPHRVHAQNGMYAAPNADGKYEILDRGSVPNWETDPKFKQDVFTFARVQYTSGYNGGGRRFFQSAESSQPNRNDVFAQRGRGGRGGGRGRGFGGGGGGWRTDFPEADLNFSYRLHQLTSLHVNPTPVVVRLTDPELFDYPFIYMVEVLGGDLQFTPDEITALRRYLQNGGFLMVDDFWGDYAWEHFYDEIKRVFPDREPLDIPLKHEIFHCVYNIKQFPQVPSINSISPAMAAQGITWENHGPGCETVHYRGIFDDKNRLMVLICHNTDLGDGWEREGYDEWYFHEFCENKSYPMGINIVTYALTH